MKKFKIIAPITLGVLVIGALVFLGIRDKKDQPKQPINNIEDFTFVPSKSNQNLIDEVVDDNQESPAKEVYNEYNIDNIPVSINYNGEPAELIEIEEWEGYKKHPLANPPIEGLAPEGKVYSINANIPQTITSEAGSTIHIPANTFVNKDGETVKGNVEVYYCEYNEPFDFITSGIPMTYGAGGKVNHFESAGMFDIQATSEGKEVKIGKGKEIKVDVASRNGDENFNFYELNAERGDWVEQQSNLPTFTYQLIEPNFNKKDMTSFDDRYASLNYFSNYRIGQTSNREVRKGKTIKVANYMPTKNGYVKSHYKLTSRPVDRIIHLKSAFKIKRMPKEIGDDNTVVRFKVIPRNKLYRMPLHLKQILNKTWVYKGNLNRHEFWREFSRLKRYEDVRVHYKQGSDNFTLELKTLKGFVKFDAYVYNENPDEVSVAEESKYSRRFIKSYDRYKKSLNDYRNVFNESLIYQRDGQVSYEYITKGTGVAARDAAYDLVSRTVSLTNLGVYNCDRIMAMKNPQKTIAKFNLEDTDETVKPEIVYVVDKSANGIYTYAPEDLVVDPDNTKCLILILGNNKLAFVNSSKVKEGFGKGISHFTAKIPESKDRFGLKEELGL